MDRYAAMVSRWLAALGLLLAWGSSFAYTDWEYAEWSTSNPTGWWSSADAACAGIAAAKTPPTTVSGKTLTKATFPRVYSCQFANSTTQSTTESCGHLPNGLWTNDAANFRCVRTVAECPAPKVPDANGVCQPPPPCSQGNVVASGYFDIGTDGSKHPQLSGCVSGCQVAFDGVSPAGNALVDGIKHYFALGEYVTTGAECTAGTNPGQGAPDVPPPDCAEGQVLGEVNGEPVCAAGETGAPAVPPKTETETTTKTAPVDNGDGTTTETETTTREVTNPDGTTGTQTQTKTTTCDQAGNCTTTTETETDGAYVDPDAQEEQPSECELHPNTAGCAELDTPTGPDLPTSNISIAGVSPQSGWGADNGTCPALVHTVSLGDVDVFGLVCTYMQGIRFLVIGIAWLIAALIFIGRTD